LLSARPPSHKALPNQGLRLPRPRHKLALSRLRPSAIKSSKPLLSQSYAAKIGAQKDATSRQKLQNEANKQMINAVQNSPDMTVEEYKSIVSTAQTDPEVARKVQEKLKANAVQ
jgi:hypothetical protein